MMPNTARRINDFTGMFRVIRAGLSWLCPSACALGAVILLSFLCVALQMLASSQKFRHGLKYPADAAIAVLPRGKAIPGSGPWPSMDPGFQRFTHADQSRVDQAWESGGVVSAFVTACFMASVQPLEPVVWQRSRPQIVRPKPSAYLPAVTSMQGDACGRPFDWSQDSLMDYGWGWVRQLIEFVWNGMVFRYVAWHLGAVALCRLSHRWIASRDRGRQSSPQPVPWPRHLFFSALIALCIPAIAEAAYAGWLVVAWNDFSSFAADLHPVGLFASVGIAGLTGVWLGAIVAHALIVHACGRGPLRRLWWTGVAAAFMLFNTPIVLAWLSRALPESWVQAAIPY